MITYYSLIFGVVFVGALLYFFLSVVLKNLSHEKDAVQKKPLLKMNGLIVDKFFDGEEIIVGGSPTFLISICLNNKSHEVKHYVEQKLYMKYDIGDRIDLFVNNHKKLIIYTVDEIKGTI
jgi:hypothetical protein